MSDIIRMMEHGPFPNSESNRLYDSKLAGGLCLNPEAKSFDQRYFVQWMQWGNSCGYYASYVIGTQWVDTDQGRKAVVVLPKIENIDYLKMFMTCFFCRKGAETFHKIYHIDIQESPICCPGMDSILSPMIVVHFLSVVQRLVAKGLKKSYIRRENNLRKVRGQIATTENETLNIRLKRFDRIYCKYQEFSENTPENQLLKAALKYALSFLQRQPGNGAQPLLQVAHKCLAYMHGVDDQYDLKSICQTKRNKLYREYDEALQLAKLILRHFDYAISQTEVHQDVVHPFWIDLSLLYERYVYGLLDEAYPGDIVYQFHGNSGYPDFLSCSTKMILDTKYIPRIDSEKLDSYIVRQLAGYSRDEMIIRELQEDREKVIPCVLIYPNQRASNNPFHEPLDTLALRTPISGFSKFYSIGVSLPVLE